MQRVGASELTVPTLGLGTGPLGGMKASVNDAQSDSVLDQAWVSGIRFFDTAPWYGTTQSEHRLGRYLRNKPRDEFVVTTKVGRVFKRPDRGFDFERSQWRERWPGGLPFVPHFDYSAGPILRSWEDSLQRLGLPRVDGLAIHDLDPRHRKTDAGVDGGFRQLDQEGGFAALQDLKRSGEIAAIGAGINLPGLIPRFLEHFDIDYFVLAMPYTLLDQQALAEELPLCEARGASVIIGAPFASGILATGTTAEATYQYKRADEPVRERVRAIETVCDAFDVPIAAAALQFPVAHPAVVSVIPGADTANHVQANVAAFGIEIPSELWAALKEKGLIAADAPVP
ncbi:aldo/keto reductase [Bauldia sp.]|uniref:aldo/keto reductase n=1 Tax=Bauldia sp. TaxID=2575872 RepID=UPI003BA8D5E7